MNNLIIKIQNSKFIDEDFKKKLIAILPKSNENQVNLLNDFFNQAEEKIKKINEKFEKIKIEKGKSLLIQIKTKSNQIQKKALNNLESEQKKQDDEIEKNLLNQLN